MMFSSYSLFGNGATASSSAAAGEKAVDCGSAAHRTGCHSRRFSERTEIHSVRDPELVNLMNAHRVAQGEVAGQRRTCLGAVSKWSSFSNGSSSICTSRHSSAPPRTPTSRKSGSPCRCTCSWSSSTSVSPYFRASIENLQILRVTQHRVQSERNLQRWLVFNQLVTGMMRRM